MPSLSDVTIGGYAVVMTGITLLLMGVLESCNMVNLPPIAEHGGLAKEECYAMTTAMMKAAPRGKETAGEILALFFHVVFRIEQNYIVCSAVAAWYVLLKCPSAAARKPWHLFLALLSVFCAASDATFAGLPIGLGSTALELSDAAKASITLPFIPVWTVLGVLNALAFVGGKGKSA